VGNDEKPVDFAPEYNILGQPKEKLRYSKDSDPDSNKRRVKKIVFIISLILLIASLIKYLQSYNKDNNTKHRQIEKINKVADSDFIYTDTIEGFKIIVKKGMQYLPGKRPHTLVTIGTVDSISNNISYMVNKGQVERGVSPEKFLLDFQDRPSSDPKITYVITDMQISNYKDGFKMGQAAIEITGEAHITHYGTIRIYVIGETSYRIMVLYIYPFQAAQQSKLTVEILNSFEILQ